MFDDPYAAPESGESDSFKFILFAGFSYYPEKGAKDFVSAHQTLDAAEAAMDALMEKGVKDWAHIAELAVDDLIIVKTAGMG